MKLNEKAKKAIKEIKYILQYYYVDKNAIQKSFDEHFKKVGLPKRKVELYDNLNGWGAVCETVKKVKEDTAWKEIRDTLYRTTQTAPALLGNTQMVVWDIVKNTAWYIAWDAIYGTFFNIAFNFPIEDYYYWKAVLGTVVSIPRNAPLDATWYVACLNCCDKDDNCKICKFRKKFCELQFNLLKNGVFFYWVFENKVIVITRPKIIRCQKGKLHSTTTPALEWEGAKYYSLQGEIVRKDVWQKTIHQLKYE